MYNIDISYIPHEHINIYLVMVSLGLVTLPVKEGTAVKISPSFAMNFERKPLSANGIKKLKPGCTYDFFIGPESDHWQCLSVTNSLTD